MIDKTETQQTLVTLTPAASEKVRELLEQEGDASLGLRIFVAGGGCSGMQYGMTLDEEQEGDVVMELDGIRMLNDEMSAGCTVNNPNAFSTCCCGHSFKTAGDSGEARSCGCGH